MKKFFFAIAAVACMVSGCQKGGNGSALKNQTDSVSYALGTMVATQIVSNLKQFPFDTIDHKAVAKMFAKSKPSERYMEFVKQQLDTISEPVFMKAFRQQLKKGRTIMDPQTAEQLLNARSTEVRNRQQAERERISKENDEKGKAFLAANVEKEGVHVTESGLQYKVIKEGNGQKPEISDRVKVNYRGTLIDGTEFDANEGAEFGLRGVVKGWTEALQMMREGSKWQIYVPATLAYGPRGGGEKIGPNETLIFDIELLEVIKKK